MLIKANNTELLSHSVPADQVNFTVVEPSMTRKVHTCEVQTGSQLDQAFGSTRRLLIGITLSLILVGVSLLAGVSIWSLEVTQESLIKQFITASLFGSFFLFGVCGSVYGISVYFERKRQMKDFQKSWDRSWTGLR